MDEDDLEDLRRTVGRGRNGSVMVLIVKDDDYDDTLTGIIKNLFIY